MKIFRILIVLMVLASGFYACVNTLLSKEIFSDMI